MTHVVVIVLSNIAGWLGAAGLITRAFRKGITHLRRFVVATEANTKAVLKLTSGMASLDGRVAALELARAGTADPPNTGGA